VFFGSSVEVVTVTLYVLVEAKHVKVVDVVWAVHKVDWIDTSAGNKTTKLPESAEEGILLLGFVTVKV